MTVVPRHAVLTLCGLALVAAVPPRGPVRAAPDPARVERLLRLLGHDDFDERERASAALEALGDEVLPDLRAAAGAARDTEVRRRSELLIAAIEGRPDRELRRLAGHRSAVLCAVYSPDGKRILSASWDRTLRLWDAA